jgi:hypothetical protein
VLLRWGIPSQIAFQENELGETDRYVIFAVLVVPRIWNDEITVRSFVPTNWAAAANRGYLFAQ